VADLLGDLRASIWSELSGSRVRVDVYRRNLQRAYIEVVARYLVTPTGVRIGAVGAASDARALLRGDLIELRLAIRSAVSRAGDANTRLHLRDLDHEIGMVLEPAR
jgi:hypothetical protein